MKHTHKLPTSTQSHVIIAKGFKISAFHCYRLGFEELWYVDEDCEEETGEDVEQGAMLLMLQTVVRSGKFFEINNNNNIVVNTTTTNNNNGGEVWKQTFL